MKKTSLVYIHVILFMITFSLFARGKVHDDLPPDKIYTELAEDALFAPSIAIPGINCLPADTEVCINEIVNYAATNVANHTYLWTVTGGTAPPTTGNSINVTWGNPGVGSVSVVILGPLGDTVKTCSWAVTIHPLPEPVISASFASGCDDGKEHTGLRDSVECIKACDSTTVIYSTPLHTGSSYTWNVSGAISYTPSSNTVSVYWGAVGNGTVGVTETDIYGCSNYTEVCVDIIASPTAMFTTVPAPVGGVVSLCMQSLTPPLSQTLYFIDQSTAGLNTISNWYWDFGDGVTSVLQNPSHQYTAPGSYTVWLVVENECHCKDSTSIQVDVFSELGPDISCASTVCAGATETYSTTASCSVYNWVVQGGTINQTPPYGSAITVTWGSTGPGIVSLDVSGCTPSTFCSSPTSILIPIISPTTVINGPAVVCENSFVNYSVTNLPGCTYSWTVNPPGSGTIISASNTSQITVYWPFGSTGGTVKVSYNNPELNCSGTGTLNVVVGPTFAISGPKDVCAPSTVLYSAPGTFNWTVTNPSGITIQTAPGSGSISVNWPSIPGVYKVTAVDVSATYCNSPQTLSVTLYGAPPPPAIIAGTDSVCPGQSYTYTSSPTSSAYYLAWGVTGGTPSAGTGNSITVTWNTTPPYAINLYQVGVAAPSCSSAVLTKTVYPKTLASPNINGLLSTCNNVIESYSATPSNGDTYTWTVTPSTFGSVVSGQGTPNVNVQWNNSIGAATLQVVITSCGGTTSKSVIVNLTAPPPPVIISADSSCEGYVFNFTSGTSGSLYDWNFGDGNSVSTTSISTSNIYALAGNYNVTLTVTDPNGCTGTSTTSKYVLIHQSPTANLTTPDPIVYCTGQPISTTLYINSQPGNTFQWFGPGGYMGAASSYNVAAAGSYYVIVTGPNGCTRTSNTITIKQIPCNPCNVDPSASISYNASTPVCNVVNFNGFYSTNGRIIGWDFDDPNSGPNNFSTAPSPTHTFSQSGYYNVSFSGMFFGVPDSCVLTDIQTIVIPAVAGFEWEIIGCAGGGFVFDFYDKSNFVSPYSITSWNWSFTGGSPGSSSTQNPTGIFLTPGQHIISLTINSSYPSVCTFTDTINVPNLPVAGFTSVDSVCDGNPVVFTSTSTGSSLQHVWDFGDLSGSLIAPVTSRTYDTPGTYTASLTVTDVYGCSSFISKPIVVTPNTLGVSVTAGGPTTFCQGDNVLLTANPGGGTPPYGYLWAPPSLTTSSITVNQTGDYSVTLSDLKGCLKTSAPVSVIVNEAPPAIITGPTDYCVNEDIELSANQGPANTYDWYVNGSYYSSGPTLTYPTNSLTPATVNVQVIVTGPAPNYCADTSIVMQVNVHQLPMTPTITPGSTYLCAGMPITLTAVSPEGYTDFSWSTGQTGSVITVQQGGLYTVTVYNQYGCGSEANINIGDLPDFSDLMTGCYDLCDSADVLWIGPLGYFSYEWLFNGNPIVPAQTSSSILMPSSLSGTYNLVMTTYFGCTDTSADIVINFIPCNDPCDLQAAFDFNQVDHCKFDFFEFSTVGAGWTIYDWHWDFGDGTTLNGIQNPSHTYTADGLYNVCVIVFATNGIDICTDTICWDVYVVGCGDPCDIQAAFDFNQIDPCTFKFFEFSSVPAGWTIFNWDWDFGDGFTLSGVPNPTHTYTSDGLYQVCLTVWATNGTDTCTAVICWDVFVKGCKPGPCKITAGFDFNQLDPCKFDFTDYSIAPVGVSIYDWFWDFGDGTTLSGVQNPTHIFPGDGVYHVCLTVYGFNGTQYCSRTICMDIYVSGCDDANPSTSQSSSEQLEVWPNPSDGRYYLDVDIKDMKNDNIKVYNVRGEEVHFETGVENGQSFIQLNTAQDGLYILTLRKEGVLYQTRLMKH